MKSISLKDLLEAGCHFGHRSEKWHPKASDYIYQAREGIHIIDLVKTRDSLAKAAEYIKELVKNGQTVLFVATKRQAKGVVRESCQRVGIPYMTNRWIGGFLTNWEEVKKNIDKLNKYYQESKDGSWDKFPKHEAIKLKKAMRRLEVVYEGVKNLQELPDALFIVDIKKEMNALKESSRKNKKTIAIVDTNVNPTLVDFPIPANDDAVGSIKFIVNYLVEAYKQGKGLYEKQAKKIKEKEEKEKKKKEEEVKKQIEKKETKKEEKKKTTKKESKKSS